MTDLDSIGFEIDDSQSELVKAVDRFQKETGALLDKAGQPIYSPQIHNERLRAAHNSLNTNRDFLRERVETAKASAEAMHARAMRNPYTWLSPDELQRAHLLAPFVAEDIQRGGAAYLADVDAGVNFGRLELERASAWLHHRAAKAAGVDAPFIERAAWPASAVAAEEAARRARKVLDDIRRADPLHDIRQLQRTGFNVTY